MNFKFIRLIHFIAFVLIISACSDDNGLTPDPNDKWAYHRNNVGASANHLLSNKDFNRITVEILYMDGARPTNQSIDALETFIEESLHKGAGINIKLTEISDPGHQSYSIDDVIALEEDGRTEFSAGSKIAVSFLFINGASDRDDGDRRILGIAYYNTSMVIFHETIRDISGGVGQPSRTNVEQTVVNHEFGHILGLVDIGSPMQTDHIDEGRGAHCDNDECLMHYTMKSDDIVSVLLSGGSVPEFDQNCLNDLKANGGR
jgi:hypothetical protein